MYSLHGAFIIRHIHGSLQEIYPEYFKFLQKVYEGLRFFCPVFQESNVSERTPSGAALTAPGATFLHRSECQKSSQQPFRHHSPGEGEVAFAMEHESSDGACSLGRRNLFPDYLGFHDSFKGSFSVSQFGAAQGDQVQEFLRFFGIRKISFQFQSVSQSFVSGAVLFHHLQKHFLRFRGVSQGLLFRIVPYAYACHDLFLLGFPGRFREVEKECLRLHTGKSLGIFDICDGFYLSASFFANLPVTSIGFSDLHGVSEGNLHGSRGGPASCIFLYRPGHEIVQERGEDSPVGDARKAVPKGKGGKFYGGSLFFGVPEDGKVQSFGVRFLGAAYEAFRVAAKFMRHIQDASSRGRELTPGIRFGRVFLWIYSDSSGGAGIFKSLRFSGKFLEDPRLQ
jgi:hypothetical protein